MRFEYNADLEYEERIDLVAKEIMEVYPNISYKDASLAAAHTMPIDDKVTNDDKFDRYYFLLKVLGRKNVLFYYVFNDAFKLYQEGLEQDIYNSAMLKIVDYANGLIDTIPELIEC